MCGTPKSGLRDALPTPHFTSTVKMYHNQSPATHYLAGHQCQYCSRKDNYLAVLLWLFGACPNLYLLYCRLLYSFISNVLGFCDIKPVCMLLSACCCLHVLISVVCVCYMFSCVCVRKEREGLGRSH